MTQPRTKLLVCFRDFSADGSTIGPGTTARLEAASNWLHKEASAYPPCELVAVGGPSPHQDVTTTPVSVLQAEYLSATHPQLPVHTDTVYTGWRTDHELDTFFRYVGSDDQVVIVSARYHLPRVFCLVWKQRGWRAARQITYHATTDDPTTLYKLTLEASKLCYLILPRLLQEPIYQAYLRFGLTLDRRH